MVWEATGVSAMELLSICNDIICVKLLECYLLHSTCSTNIFQVALVVKNSTCQCRRRKRGRFNPWVGKISWRRAWQPTPVFLPENFHGQRSLLGYSPWGCSQTRLKGLSAHQLSDGPQLKLYEQETFQAVISSGTLTWSWCSGG